jgi:biotin-(acetyl-CoA carboxylase) ligase
VLGVGVNCNWPADGLPESIRNSATSLSAELAGPVDRTDLLRAMLGRLEYWLVGDVAAAEGAAGLDRLHSEYLARMDHQATRVRLHYDRQMIEGTVRDVDPLVGLMVQLSGGGIAHFQPTQVRVEWLE